MKLSTLGFAVVGVLVFIPTTIIMLVILGSDLIIKTAITAVATVWFR